MIILISATTPFSYENQNQEEIIKPLNIYNRIKLSFSVIARSVSENKYKNYNSQKSYDPGKKGALA
jgi:hypothetical protein